MVRRREEEQRRLLERGAVSFYYRPRVEAFDPEGIDDVQRLLMVLSPERRARFRVIAIGRKRLPQPSERFWGFVDLVLDSEHDLRAALAAQTYGTKTRGVRHLPAARPAASGSYRLQWHDEHCHLSYDIERMRENDPVVDELCIEPEGDFILMVANPDPAAWEMAEVPCLQLDLFDEAEVHVTVPTPFPPRLQARFGDHRFVPLDTTNFLDHPGAELVFIAGGRAASSSP